MNEDLRARLRRLGVVKGIRNLKSAPPTGDSRRSQHSRGRKVDLTDFTLADEPGEAQPLEVLLPGGRLQETAEGSYFVLDTVYPVHHQHGMDRLADLLRFRPTPAASFCQDERLRRLDFRDLLFLDTETTGLAGAGTIAFMVGVAFFEPGGVGRSEAMVVRQYFLRDHGDEPAMLLSLAELLAEKGGLITFNGRSFDLPLLDNRYLMNRLSSTVLDLPHIDLLPPSRRLWRRRLGSCALGALEQNLLGLQRTHQDVPGWLIPSLYHDYLRTGDARQMLRVFYHNRIDMLSMVTLASRVISQFAHADVGDHPIDLYSVGKWQADLGLTAESERALRLAVSGDLPLEWYHRALHRLGLLLKRNGRREEAVEVWQQIAATAFDDVAAHVELAKHYEWQHRDFAAAMQWTQQALALVERWHQPERAELVREELEHRLARLRRKHSSA